jgi:DNA-binding transcriptional ArsR family regulator
MGGPVAASNRTFQALADGTRRDILRLLRDGPRTSGDLAAQFSSSWPTVSRHLGVLREAGLVVAERDGQEIRYELNTSVFQDLIQHLIEWTRPTPKRVNRKNERRRRAVREQEA